jgi:hypothetical protein
MPKRVDLSAEQIEAAHQLWNAGAPADEIAAAIAISIDTFRARRRDQLRELPLRNRRANSGRRGVDPTPADIRVETAMLREAWPDERFHSPPPENTVARCDRETAAVP